MPKSLRGLALSLSNGFTLIELLVVISIIAILSAVGLVSYNGIRTKALEAQRISNIDAIKKALETKFDPTANGGQGGYKAILDTDFASGKIPVPNPSAPSLSSNTYLKTTANSDGTYANFYACVNKADGSVCYGQSPSCYCKSSNQGAPVTVPQNGGAASCDPSGNLLNGLVGYWRFDEGSGSTTADYTQNGTPAVIYGTVNWSGTSVKPVFNNALNFNGSNNYVLAPPNNILNNGAADQFTASVWIKPTNISSYPGLLNKGWDWLVNGGQGCFRWPDCRYLWFSVPNNVWTNVVLTYNKSLASNNLRVYTQGVFRSPAANYTAGASNNLPLNIGGAGNGKFSGLMDDVRIYNRVLSDSEIATLYNSGNGCIP